MSIQSPSKCNSRRDPLPRCEGRSSSFGLHYFLFPEGLYEWKSSQTNEEVKGEVKEVAGDFFEKAPKNCVPASPPASKWIVKK